MLWQKRLVLRWEAKYLGQFWARCAHSGPKGISTRKKWRTAAGLRRSCLHLYVSLPIHGNMRHSSTQNHKSQHVLFEDFLMAMSRGLAAQKYPIAADNSNIQKPRWGDDGWSWWALDFAKSLFIFKFNSVKFKLFVFDYLVSSRTDN